MNTEPPRPVLIGARYLMDGRFYEVINITKELLSFKDTEGRRAVYICPDDFNQLLHHKEVILAECAPLAVSTSVRMLNSEDPQVNAAKRKHFYVMGIRESFQGILPKKACLRELEVLRKQFGDPRPPSYGSLWKWTQACKRANWSPWSLIKPTSVLPRGKFTPDETSKIIDRYINEVYLNDQRHSVAYVYSLIKGEIYNNNRLRRETNSRIIHMPSESTVRRRIIKLCGLLRDTRRLGVRAGQKANKSSSQWVEPTYLLEMCGIDCKTPMDIILVDTDGQPLGKIAHLQAMIDIKSRKIIAYDLSKTPPCAGKTLRVLRMALQAVPGEELQRGKMVLIIGDNGSENFNDTVIVILNALGIQYVFIPKKQSDANAHIESFFKTVNSFVHSLPGTTFSNPEQRGDYDSVAKACLTIEELQEKFSDWLENVYHQTKHSELNMTPNAKWDRAMAKQLPPEKISKADLDGILRAVEHRSINGGRVNLLNLQWSGPGLAELKHKLKPKQKAVIYYDISDLGEVWVAHPEHPTELVRAVAVNPAYQKGLTLYEHELVCEQLALEGKEYSDEIACCSLLRIHQEIAEKKKQHKAKQKKPTTSAATEHQAVTAPTAHPFTSGTDDDTTPGPSGPLRGFYLE
ncbi:hypothetical protein BLL42_22240 [Pseudomonas frederiksbergensis]|uniref:Integrase catalytic domain-containing protein n=1 Tax=Pseudomonas frederiksbergensis TaxID=104087 RepID=A0A1J0ER80_9PSED|nr:DDE-type integrase/transposase/recombinase [Pseudomonas frederiksbergensis]APC18308.1 hypothetical protein BLL42_22240 [Pseudomonas frederiksbergensis]